MLSEKERIELQESHCRCYGADASEGNRDPDNAWADVHKAGYASHYNTPTNRAAFFAAYAALEAQKAIHAPHTMFQCVSGFNDRNHDYKVFSHGWHIATFSALGSKQRYTGHRYSLIDFSGKPITIPRVKDTPEYLGAATKAEFLGAIARYFEHIPTVDQIAARELAAVQKKDAEHATNKTEEANYVRKKHASGLYYALRSLHNATEPSIGESNERIEARKLIETIDVEIAEAHRRLDAEHLESSRAK